jgi:hypothetical protein
MHQSHPNGSRSGDERLGVHRSNGMVSTDTRSNDRHGGGASDMM